MFAQSADVAELVDAQVSEACCREAVEVRFFSSAPKSDAAARTSVRAYHAQLSWVLRPCLHAGFCTFVMRSEFIESIKVHQAAFGLNLIDKQIKTLTDYYVLIQDNNEFLHLVAPMPAEEFAIRHILESLTLLEYLPLNARFADVGAGAGLPSIPCLLVRDDLRAVLIESKVKKARFLEAAVDRLSLAGRVEIVNRQFEETEPGNCQFVTCRALDKFTEKLPRLIKWSMRRQMLLFGGKNLKKTLQDQKIVFAQKLMSMSEQRFLFVTNS